MYGAATSGFTANKVSKNEDVSKMEDEYDF